MNKFYVYIIQNTLNNKIYVGKTSNPTKRFSDHKTIANGRKPNEFKSIHAAIKKYGFQNFKFYVIEEIINERESYEAEIFWINFYNSYENGYNETRGGEGFRSGLENPMFGKKHSNTTKLKMSQKQSGSLNPNFGKKMSEKTKNLISIKNKQNIGENNPRALLTNLDAHEIRNKFVNKKISITDLSIEYDVKRNVIERILRNETYKENN